jgi:hypothetical protein
MYLALYNYTLVVVTTIVVVVDVLVLEKLNHHGHPDHILTSENELGVDATLLFNLNDFRYIVNFVLDWV